VENAPQWCSRRSRLRLGSASIQPARPADPFSLLAVIPNTGAASIQLGTRGPLSSPCTACAASQMAIGDGLDVIRLGRVEVMLCGGTDAAITRAGIAGFAAMRALSRRNDDPAAASRPFDADRDGFVMGEAGAILVLEELEHAQKRDAKVYAELLGYGVSSDAQHISEPDPTGRNPARAMKMAFADAGINPEQIDYINAHGTSTPLGDASETRVIKRAGAECTTADLPAADRRESFDHHGLAPRSLSSEHTAPRCRSSDRRQYERL
jgi:3-oxoacyl-[acyl-carrier-protein] synthase II